MNQKDLENFVRPLYKKKDSTHDFSHILRIKKSVKLIKKDYKNINEELLNFLVYFHGLKDFVKHNENDIIALGFTKKYITALYRHTKKPISIEEKVVSDANLLESIGKTGIRRGLTVGKERNQTQEQTLKIMKSNIRKVKFYTKLGKKLGNPRKTISIEFLRIH